MGIDKDGFNNFAWELFYLEDNQASHEAELITASFRRLQDVLAGNVEDFRVTEVFDEISGCGERELFRQIDDSRAIHKRPEKRWEGGTWWPYESNYWRLEVVNTTEQPESNDPEYAITVSSSAASDIFEEGVMPKIHVIDIIFDGTRYPLGGQLSEGVYTEPRVQKYLDDMIDSLKS